MFSRAVLHLPVMSAQTSTRGCRDASHTLVWWKRVGLPLAVCRCATSRQTPRASGRRPTGIVTAAMAASTTSKRLCSTRCSIGAPTGAARPPPPPQRLRGRGRTMSISRGCCGVAASFAERFGCRPAVRHQRGTAAHTCTHLQSGGWRSWDPKATRT
jgi:hypothetical protein